MARNGQLVRQWKVLRILLSHRYGVSLSDLAFMLDVSTRTMRRDLECLEAAGFLLFQNISDEGKKWGCSREEISRILVHLRKTKDEL